MITKYVNNFLYLILLIKIQSLRLKKQQFLSFLDVEIKLLGSAVETLLWRKSSQTRLLLKFNAICSET